MSNEISSRLKMSCRCSRPTLFRNESIVGGLRVFHFAKIFEIQGGLLNWGAQY